MSRIRSSLILLISAVLGTGLLVACGQPSSDAPAMTPSITPDVADSASPTAEISASEPEEPLLSPCLLGLDDIGEQVRISGIVIDIEPFDDGSLLFFIERDDCPIGVWVDSELSETWEQNALDLVVQGNELVVVGYFNENETIDVISPPIRFVEPTATPTTRPSYKVTYQVTNNPQTRWQDITLQVTDWQGNPLSGSELTYDQLDLEFMFSVEYHGIPPEEFAENYEQQYWELGINTWRYGLIWLWSTIEPERGDYRWWLDYPAAFCPAVAVGEEEECRREHWYRPAIPQDRQERMRGSADMGLYPPNFQENINQGNFPAFANPADLDGTFKQDYGNFLAAVVENYRGTIDLYRLGLEVNLGIWTGPLQQKDYAWFVDWVVWQCDLIKSIDPDALISIDLGDQRNVDWDTDPQTQPWFPGSRVKPMWEDDFVRLLLDAGADFDVIGIELHPGWNTSFEDTERTLTLLEQFGKPIYIWEAFVPSVDEASAVATCRRSGVCPAGGYSEQYQADQLVALFESAIEAHPMVIGVEHITFVDDPSDEWGTSGGVAPTMNGLVRQDGTLKPAYTALREYWYSLFTHGTAITDSSGQVTFRAIPGYFQVTVEDMQLVLSLLEGAQGATE